MSANPKLIPQQEYILQGSINDSALEMLLHRLQGLCDNADSPAETFLDREYVYSIRNPNGQAVLLRVRQDLERKDYPWHLRYLGQPEIGDKTRATLVRSCIDVACSNNVGQFLQEMGFKKDYEFYSKGYMFKKGRLKVIVAKVFHLLTPEANQSQQPVFSENNLETVTQSHLVEVSIVAPSGSDPLADEIKQFADQLKPLVDLVKIDPRRLA
ncbi:mediator of RNA polymerase II transcription subunit 18-like [Panonychus citri]|uniref:mediator of RNA polymerase II transcription subunit 18-like n=1 Tax=Panonychus citri TaxID=50023 RepID=UPI002307038C|nr:mediator of RNA polymerase II transcription subunit 18-like [Panonychus citri]